jgi:hypothetical protein
LAHVGDGDLPPMPLPEFQFEELLDAWKIVTALSLLIALR